MQIKKILVPIDGSKHSLRALEAAKDISETFDSKIVLLHVVDLDNVGECATHAQDDDTLEKIRSERASILDEADNEVGNVASEKHCVLGNPSEEILKKLDEDDIDLIVIAKKGLSGIERYVIGSVSAKVIEHSPKPVYLIK